MTSPAYEGTGDGALIVENLSKRFGGAVALNGVSMSVRAGEVHGLLGTNGSGKSTLIKILSGYHAPEPGGRVNLFGHALPLPVRSAEARSRGLAFVHQHLALVPALSVTENLMLGRLSARNCWRLDWRDEHESARAVFDRYDIALDPRAPLASLSAVERALLAIMRAVEDLHAATGEKGRGVLVLDEPTPFLPKAGVEQLFDLVRQCTNEGAAVIFVSHDVDEVRAITDRATILRDGHKVETVDTAQTSHGEFVRAIVGKTLDSFHVHEQTSEQTTKDPIASVSGLTAPGLGPVALSVHEGEIVGMTGLIGSGFDDVCGLIYGERTAASGTFTLGGRERHLHMQTPQDALRAGIVYLPSDRLGAAGVADLSITDNVVLPVLRQLRGGFGLSRARMRSRATKACDAAGVVPNAPQLPLSALSGGNQQKALIAKWLQVDPRLILLDEPTQGVDVGARQRLWSLLDEASLAGAGILIASTDYDQLAHICHRVLIFSRGQIVAELTGPMPTKQSISEHCYKSIKNVA